MASALTPQEFIDAARQAAFTVGASFSAPISLEPAADAQWNVAPTSPQ